MLRLYRRSVLLHKLDCTMEEEEFNEHIREKLPESFSDHHLVLIKICFGVLKPDPSALKPVSDERCLQHSDLQRYYAMVLVEFSASLGKEMKGSDETKPKGDDPNPYDVFLVETTLDHPTKHIAVCVPIRKRRELAWYNGGNELIPVGDLSPKWRVASLSGPARVLAALLEPPTLLTEMSMQRSMIADIYEDVNRLDTLAWDEDLKQRFCLLNDSQRAALATVLSPQFSQGFLPIQGPPGCGKTSFLVAAIAALGESILVVAPSNAAVANVALKVYETGRFGLDEISVFGENTDPTAHFLNPKKRGEKHVHFLLEHEKAEKHPEKQERLRKELIQWLHLDEADDELSLEQLKRFCLFYNMESAQGRYDFGNHLAQSKIVFSTLNSAASPTLTRNVCARTLMLDEGGQSPEAEFFIATNFPGIERIIVVGDPMQLPATVIDMECKGKGYGVSWLEKIYRLQPDKVHLLNTQYRMHPQILAFPNRNFYQGRILSGDNVLVREPFVAKPFIFIDTCRRGSEEQDAFSWRNVYEGVVIQALLHQDDDIQRLFRDPRPTRVIVITPYAAQVKLLKETLICPLGCNLEVATVDSFQGQEADIVILSMVRTNKIGFADDRQRLNVATTRAKRILRVVGDAAFFESLPKGSTLKKLCKYASFIDCLEKSEIRQVAWARPNWNLSTLWSPVANVRFCDRLKNLAVRDKNICLNTLHAVATPDISAIGPRIPRRERPSWYTSFLRGYGDQLRIVWIAKEGNDKPIIEAHYAGSQLECNRFIQIHSDVPMEARSVEPDLSRIVASQAAENGSNDISLPMNQLFVAWPVTNSMQNAVFEGKELPSGGVQLDRCQEEVARATPPLIVESRSGTGKTLALLQHAAYHCTDATESANEARTALFVTMSRRLRNQLLKKYDELNESANFQLPETSFYSFEQLIDRLVKYSGVGPSFDGKDRCRYLAFIESQTLHKAPTIDQHLMENEIGGVISGSIDAARQGAPLSRDQYLTTKRSNIDNETDQGQRDRELVYEEYKRYSVWKRNTSKYDLNDVLLCLLQKQWPILFSSAYLDEIQDLSYAAIYLICSIAGKDALKWVCAGDTAQMVSPGCSFTFAGLKDTLLAVRAGIESKLSKVTQLLVNYRTTKDVLILGNEILSIAKKAFPGAIAFARPEKAIKDLGIKVVLCDWEECFSQTGIKLGRNQALIYSCRDSEAFETSATAWIGSHPFILSSLDSKGLEFDDVIIAFDLDRKTWNISRQKIASLKMLRELYVAVTRAQKRVVILIKSKDHAMKQFFEQMEYEFQVTGAELTQMEFDQETTAAMWRQKGIELFEDEQFVMASRCFDSSGDRGWSEYAHGRHLHGYGNKSAAIEAYHVAFSEFFTASEYKLCLDIALIPTKFASWDLSDNKKLDLAMMQCPNYLGRNDVVRLNLLCNRWDDMGVEDLKDHYLSDILLLYRSHPSLVRLVQVASEQDRIEMEETIPGIIGDYHHSKGSVDVAARLYLKANECNTAQQSTAVALKRLQTNGDGQAVLSRCVDHWKASRMNPTNATLSLLMQLFQSPTKAASFTPEECLSFLGRNVIIESVDHAKLDRTVLYDFSTSEFLVEVTSFLESSYSRRQVEVVRWFASRNNKAHATHVAKKRLSKWTVKEICAITLILGQPDAWIVKEIHKRKIVDTYILALMGSNTIPREQKHQCADKFRSTQKQPLGQTHQSLVSLALELFGPLSKAISETEINDKVATCVWKFPWTDASLVKLTQSMRSIAQILQSVNPACDEFPIYYAGIFRQASHNSDLFVQTITTAPKNDQPWLLKAFEAYNTDIVRLLQSDTAVKFVGVALKGNLWDLGLALSWKALATHWSAREYWLDVADYWNQKEEYRQWLLKELKANVNDGVTGLWQVILIANPRVSAAGPHRDNQVARMIHLYGPAVTHYCIANHRQRDHNPILLQRLVEHERQLRARLSEVQRKVDGAGSGSKPNSNTNRNKKKKNKKKNKNNRR